MGAVFPVGNKRILPPTRWVHTVSLATMPARSKRSARTEPSIAPTSATAPSPRSIAEDHTTRLLRPSTSPVTEKSSRGDAATPSAVMIDA